MIDPNDRRAVYGGLDVAAILGVNPWKAPIDVYLEKRGEVPVPPPSPGGQTPAPVGTRARWGQLLESAVCEGYTELTARRLRRVDHLSHPSIPYLVGHPDRLVVGESGLFDAKTTERRDAYGDAGTADVPPHVRVQVTVYTGLARRAWADIGLLAGTTRGLDIFTVPHDAALWEASIEALVDFHERHVLTGEPPPPDGSTSWSRYAAARFGPSETGGEMPPPTPAQELVLEELREAALAVDDAGRRFALARQRVIDMMGAHERIPTRWGPITYGWSAPSTRWKSVALALDPDPSLLAALVAQDKAGRSGSRTFRHPFHGEEADDASN